MKHNEFERPTLRFQRQKEEEDNLGVVFIKAILIVGILYVTLNLVLGWN
jgi:hypothetical protein